MVDVNDFFNRNEKTLGTVVYYVPDLGALKPAAEAVEVFTVWTALTWVFWIGVGIMSVRLLLQMISLMRFHMMSDAAKLRNRQVRVVQREVAPFSFFKNIYLNPQLHSNDELDAVIRHEQVHVEEWHSADVMMGEINNVFYWFNPGAWLMKTAIRENLEFITDRKMLRAGVDAKAYQYSLLKVSGAPYATAIANNFNFSHLKNRIMMMNKERSSRYQIVRYVVLGCMVSMLVLTLNFSRAGVKLAPVGQGTIPQLLLQDQTEKTEPQPEKKGYRGAGSNSNRL
ncbi:M56 family metallopeptidase [Chitinophaga sedimenti]|uniref:M56 family metallopeptidase n=1 Tax=Chitinophaga sedimenti TaxID=2033606 RepID=UPI0020039294|nr:M56 family metallopeptidase [Chitinophaga sedimenti]MCK7560073.1 M56 family metallopeptidase [Chitinophaga sedimenti]